MSLITFYMALTVAFVFLALFLWTYIRYSKKGRQEHPSPPKMSREEKIKQFRKIKKELEDLKRELGGEGSSSTDMVQLELLFLLREMSGRLEWLGDRLSSELTDFRSEIRSLLLFGIACTVAFGIAILGAIRYFGMS